MHHSCVGLELYFELLVDLRVNVSLYTPRDEFEGGTLGYLILDDDSALADVSYLSLVVLECSPIYSALLLICVLLCERSVLLIYIVLMFIM